MDTLDGEEVALCPVAVKHLPFPKSSSFRSVTMMAAMMGEVLKEARVAFPHAKD